MVSARRSARRMPAQPTIAVSGGAQLVAQRGDEFILQTRGPLGFRARRALADQQRFAVLLGAAALGDLRLEQPPALIEAAADHGGGGHQQQAQTPRW